MSFTCYIHLKHKLRRNYFVYSLLIHKWISIMKLKIA